MEGGESFLDLVDGDVEFSSDLSGEGLLHESEEGHPWEEDEHGCAGGPELDENDGGAYDGGRDGCSGESVESDEDEEGAPIDGELGDGEPQEFGECELSAFE